MTLADVATAAGVSVATASVAITGRPSGNCRVSPAVAEKIRAVAQKLNYRPNLQARSLSTQRTHTVAVLIKRASWHNAMFYVSAAQRVLRARGYVETFMLHPDNRAESEREHLELCLERGVEGILALPLIDLQGKVNVNTYNRLFTQEKLPIVQLGLSLPGCLAPSVTIDVENGVGKLITLLHAMGHRQIALATVPGYDSDTLFNPNIYSHRIYLGYQMGMAKLGLPTQVFVAERHIDDIHTQYDAMLPLATQVAAADPRPTAVLSISTYAAMGLLAGLNDHRVGVPHDVSVIACGDQPFARMLRPALATMPVPYETMATIATEMLLKMIDGAPGASTAVMPAVSLRESVGAIEQ